MPDEDPDETSTDDERPPALNAIPACLLTDGGRLTVHELRVRTDFSHRWTREVARDQLRAEGIISGARTTPVLACEVDSSTVTLTASIEGILDSLPPRHRTAAPRSSVEDLHEYVKKIADDEWTWGNRWEFWIDWNDPDQVAAAKELAGDLYTETAEVEASPSEQAATDGGQPQDG